MIARIVFLLHRYSTHLKDSLPEVAAVVLGGIPPEVQILAPRSSVHLADGASKVPNNTTPIEFGIHFLHERVAHLTRIEVQVLNLK